MGGGTAESGEADAALPEGEETAAQSEDASVEAESTVPESAADVSGNNADASDVDGDESGKDADSSLLAGMGEVALMALNAADVPAAQAATTTKYYAFKDLVTSDKTGSYGVTSTTSPEGLVTLAFSGQEYATQKYALPMGVTGSAITNITFHVVGTKDGEVSECFCIKIFDGDTEKKAAWQTNYIDITDSTLNGATDVNFAIVCNKVKAPMFTLDYISITTTDAQTGGSPTPPVISNYTPTGNSWDKSFKGSQLTWNWGSGYSASNVSVQDNDKLKLDFTKSEWGQMNLRLPENVDLSKCTAITYVISEQTDQVNLQLYNSAGTVVDEQQNQKGKILYRFNLNGLTGAASAICIQSNNTNTVVIDGVFFEMEQSGNVTPPATSAKDYSWMSGDMTISYDTTDTTQRVQDTTNKRWTFSFPDTSDYPEIRFTLPTSIDLSQCNSVTFAVSAQNVPLAFKLLAAGDQEIKAFYGNSEQQLYKMDTTGLTGTVTSIGVMRNIDNKTGAVTSCTFDGVMFEMKDGDTPDPTPTENLTKPVSAGNTGHCWPATAANMGYGWGTDTTHEQAGTSGVWKLVYSGRDKQSQFNLTNANIIEDLTQYNQITFAATGATNTVKFELRCQGASQDADLVWSSPAVEPSADGYYTFDLNPATFSGSKVTQVRVWSNDGAQTVYFHGVTIENNPNKTFAETREETFTADQLTTTSADAVKANGAWTVNFSGQDQDVVFNLPESVDMGKCLGITLHITTVNGPVNLFISNDGNKLESYWNTHSANGVVADSSITATGAINQFGVQAGRENDAHVPGTNITFTGITFLMSGPKLENPVVQNDTTTCSAGCFDFDNAVKDAGVTVSAQMTADGKKVAAEIVTFKQAGLNLTIEIPATVDVKYLKSIALDFKTEQYVSGQARALLGGRFAAAASGILRVAAAGGTPGVTVSLLDAGMNVIASADSSNIISLSKYFTGAKYIRFTSTGPTKMTLSNVVFNTEVPIVLNGDFVDTDVNVWTTAAWSPSVITAESAGSAIVGGVSTYGKITGRNSPYQCFAQDITARVTNGKIYKFSFWAKLSDTYKDADGSLREVAFSPYYFDENGKEQYNLVPGGTYKQSLTAGEWTYFEGTVKIPENSTGFVIRIMEQGTNYGQGDCLKGEYYVTGVKMWETDKEDPGAGNGGGGGGGGWYDPNFRVPTKQSNYQIAYEAGNLEVSWASATTATVGNSTQINFKNNYDEARFKLPRPLDMSLCAFLQLKTSNQNVPIAIKLYKNGVEVQADYYNRIDSTYVFVPKIEGNIDAVGIMSLADPNPEGAAVTVDVLTFGFTEELPPYVPPSDIVLNGDFADADLSDWHAAYWDNVTITQGTSKTPIYDDVRTYGIYSRRTSPYQCFAQDITDRVEQGETYTFSFWAKLSNDYKDAPPEQRVVQFSPYTEDKSGKADYNPRLEGTYSQTLEPGVWTYFEGTYKVTNENPISRVVIRILEQGANYGQGDCVKGSYSVTGVKMSVYVPEPPSIDEDVPNLRDVTAEDFGSDFLMGTAMAIDEVDDIGVEMLINKHFSAVTLGNELKPDALFGYSNGEHTPLQTIDFNGQSMEVPTLNYTRAEELLNKILEWNEAQPDKPIKVRGHVLVWHSQTPEWFFREGYTVKQNADGTENYVTPEVMNQRLEWYIKTVLEHFTGEDSPYKDLFYGWDVVNEAVADSGVYRTDKVNAKEQPGDSTHSNNSSWWAVYHSNEFIVNAFKYANKYAPADLELYYNDYNDSEPNKVKGIALLLSDVLAEEGTRIDAMGMQCHYTLGHPTLANMEKAIRTYAEIVGEVQLTEFDLKAAGNIGTEEGLEKEYYDQAVRYHEIYELLKKLDAEDGIEIGGFTVWGTIDSHSWLQTSSSVGGGADGTMSQCPLLFDANYKVKPAFWAFADYSKVDPEWKEAEAEEVPEETEPVEEPETPEEPSTEEELKAASVATASPKKGNPIPIIIAVCVAVAAVGGGSAYAFLRKKKDGVGTGSKK